MLNRSGEFEVRFCCEEKEKKENGALKLMINMHSIYVYVQVDKIISYTERIRLLYP